MLALEAALLEARKRNDQRPPLAIVAASLADLGIPPVAPRRSVAVLDRGRDDWLRRLRSAGRSEGCVSACRNAIDELLAWAADQVRPDDTFEEYLIVEHLNHYQRRRNPAPATYHRRFILLRRFMRWLTRKDGLPDPFLDLEAPPKGRQEQDWLTPAEFARLLAAAGRPQRRRSGLAERDRLVLLALVTTGLRRSELLALDWRDLDLDGHPTTLLVRCGKGGKPRRQPLAPQLAAELRELRDCRRPNMGDPVFCGLGGRRLQPKVLADIIRRATDRADLDTVFFAGTVQGFIHAALGHDAVADAVNELLFEHVINGRFDPSVVSASLRPMIDEVLNVATAEDWAAVTDRLAAEVRDVLGVGAGAERSRSA